ncbi:Acyl-CoA dehydrogenase [Brevibacterium sandarakinum]|uniref:Acyl-CoA dehydrogenase n=1 Tax=Brevibacterium sandarakinum TaxID=629680 RepID=A0A1H1SLK4_BRESA|nr:acyl-CoA dehydrogenase family protein [Brevibacterium sandarakinum]SDS48801.1 Acyl-CoA dehydrogenase [Brevibacterium sandarakinum]
MTITEEQSALIESVRTYCDANTATVTQRDALTEGGTESTSTKTTHDMGERGWLGISLPEEYGGLGGTFFDETLFLEESSRGLAPINAYSTGLTAAQTYLKWGNDEQRTTVCTNLANGRLEAISLSEPGTGSDLGAVTCKAELSGDEYIINGQKTWCTAAHLAENLLVLVREETTEKKHEGLTLLMVPTSTPGVEIRGIELMEPRTVNEIFFTDARVPASAVVGEAGQGWKQLMRGLSVERLIIAAMSLGAAQRSLDDTVAYVSERKAFNKPLATFQALRHRLADLHTEISFARSFVYDIAQAVDRGEEDSLGPQSSMAKLKCTEIAKQAALEGVQMMGGNGYTREYGMEGQLRTAIAPPIYGGANEVQRDIIAKNLLGRP